MTAVSLTQQQYQQFIHSLSGWKHGWRPCRHTPKLNRNRSATVADDWSKSVSSYSYHLFPRQVTEGVPSRHCLSTPETIPRTTISLSVRDEYLHERMRDLLLAGEARGYHRHRVALLTESVTHPERVLKVTDLPQAFYRWERSLKEFQRGRPAELDDDVKANAMRHMMPKDAVDLQPQYRTFPEIRDYMLQQARQRADVDVGDVCHPTKKNGTVAPRVGANTGTPTATQAMTPVPIDVSQMSSIVSKPETDEQEADSYQYEQDQECDGDEVFAVKGKGEGGFQGICFKCGMRGHKADRCWQKGKRERRQGRLGERKRWVQRKGMVKRKMVKPWSHVG